MPIKHSATASSGRRKEAPICEPCSRAAAAASSFSDLARERTRARRDEEARAEGRRAANLMEPHTAEPHHLSRLEKLPLLSPIGHINGPEVEDDKKDGDQSDDTDSDDQLPVMPPTSQQSHQHNSRMYPWLDITIIAMNSTTTATANHPTDTSVQQRIHSAYTQQQVSVVSKEVRSEPVRHGYNTITVHSNSDVTNDSSASTTGAEHLNVRTRLLPPPAPARATSNRELWRPINNIVSSYTSNPGQGRRHSILRFGSTRRTSSERVMKKSASVEFMLHDEDRVKHSPSFRKDITRISFGRDAPRRLTEEEKEELYRIRPDLEIGPMPFFKEQMEELNRRNQKRILFSMFGGIMTIMLLLVFYALFARG